MLKRLRKSLDRIRAAGFQYYFRRYAGWFPFQPCCACSRWYWGGLPTFEGWQACWMEYCSKKCHDDAEEGNF